MNTLKIALDSIDWGAFVAVIALILSQLPPVRKMIKGRRLRMAVAANTAQFAHVIGNTNMSFWLDLENVGGTTISVKRISCFLKKVGGNDQAQLITARMYWLTDSFSRDKPIELPLPEIALEPGERWSGYLHLWDIHSWTKAIESKFKTLMKQVKDDSDRNVAERDTRTGATPVASPPTFEVSSHLMQDAHEILKGLKKLEAAEYELVIAVFENLSQAPLKILGFSLTLFDADILDIFEDVEDYRFGYGIGLPAKKTKFVLVNIRPKGEKESQDLFKSIGRAP